MNTSAYNNIAGLLGGYFHQDWKLDYSTVDEVVAAYVRETPNECVQVTRNELDELISEVETMEDPDTFLWKSLHCYYAPISDGLSVAEWLGHLRQMLTQIE